MHRPSAQKVHRPTSQSPLHFDTQNTWQIRSEFFFQRSALASRRHGRVLDACVPRQDYVYNSTDKLFRFHNDEIDEMPCKLDSIENPRSLKYPTPSVVGFFERTPTPFPPFFPLFLRLDVSSFLNRTSIHTDYSQPLPSLFPPFL